MVIGVSPTPTKVAEFHPFWLRFSVDSLEGEAPAEPLRALAARRAVAHREVRPPVRTSMCGHATSFATRSTVSFAGMTELYRRHPDVIGSMSSTARRSQSNATCAVRIFTHSRVPQNLY